MSDEKVQFTTYDSVFLNTDSIFIEYDDVVKCPFFIFLMSIQNNEALQTLFNLDEINDLELEELYEWYINRKNQNILLSLPLQENVLANYFSNDYNTLKEWCYKTLYESIDQNEYYVNQETDMNFTKILTALMNGSMVNNYYMYTPLESEMIRKDIDNKFGSKIKYVYGDINTVLLENEITNNSTFVFSDVNKIKNLSETNLLNLSSIIIADKYAYNYNGDNLIFDVEELTKNAIFKLDFFDNLNANV